MNKRNNTRRKRRGGKRRRNRVTEVVLSRRDPSFPPQNNVKPSTTRSFRFFATQQVTASAVTRRCLLNIVLAGTSGSTTAVCVYEAVRLDRINMYFAPSANLGVAAEELVLSWTGDRAPDTRFSDRGTLSHPACIKCRPPKMSLAGFWSTVFADMDEPLCYITCPTDTVIDIQVAMVIGDAATKTCVIINPALSGIVYSALDNAIVAGTVGSEFMQPDSLTYANMTTP